jgi:hypothetical protein
MQQLERKMGTKITYLIQSCFAIKQRLPKHWWGYKNTDIFNGVPSVNYSIYNFGIWTISFDGTVKGCEKAFNEQRNNSAMVENIVEEILDFFEQDTRPHKEQVKNFVLQHGAWTNFSVIHSSVEHLD